MSSELHLYNSLTRKTEPFRPAHPPFAGIYVCGPTVYGHPHLGHARGPVVFDVLRRHLAHLGYQVRFVRNITDVGHLVDDVDEGEDKIAKKARAEKLEPMEVAQFYADEYSECMRLINIRKPSIEPRASGHIPEQIELIEKIIKAGLAYEVNGSVYFDVMKYSEKHHYGELSGRVLDELVAGAGAEQRKLEGQEEKRNPNDFALWKKAAPEHIMRWNSPWGVGFPGWHIECSAMSAKYLGEQFDIHGGGMDLLFPHHECEIAQSVAGHGIQPARLWMHHNMVTLNGQKMAKSLGNGVLIRELFSGRHPLLEQAYTPMTLRFFILQAHYRGTLDFSNEALKAAEKGLKRLLQAASDLEKLHPGEQNTFDPQAWREECIAALNDDLNTPILIAQLFEGVRQINLMKEGKASLSINGLSGFKANFRTFVFDILGLQTEEHGNEELVDGLVNMLIRMRNEARASKNFALSDQVRDQLAEIGVVLKDGKDGTSYTLG